MKKIAVIQEECSDKRLSQLAEAGYSVKRSLNDLAPEEEEYVEIIIGKPEPARLKSLPALRWLQLESAGLNGYERGALYASPMNITLTNASSVFSVPIAEYVIGAIILMTKRALADHLRSESLLFGRKLEMPYKYNMDITHATIGIWGTGDIGRQIARLLKGVDCYRVVGVNRMGRSYSEFDSVIALDRSDSVIGEVDIIVSAMPENSQSISFWSRKRFEQMKRNCVFINVGRGSAAHLVDVRYALRHKWISGGVLDVTDSEPTQPWSLYRLTPRLLITNHSSYYSTHNHERFNQLVDAQILNYLEGKPLLNTRNIEV